MVDYPNNPPSLPAEANYPANAPIPNRGVGSGATTVRGTSSAPSPNYYGGLQAAAAASGNAANFGAGPAAPAAPAPVAPAAPASPAAPAAPTDQMISAGQVPWGSLPNSRQMVLANVFGAAAPTVYEEARTGAGRSGVPRQQDAWDTAGPGVGISKLLGGPGPDQPTPVRPGEGPVGAFSRGYGGGQPATAALPPIPEGPPVTNVGKNVPASAVPPVGAPRASPIPVPQPSFLTEGYGRPPSTFTPHMPPTNVSRGAPQPAPPVGSTLPGPEADVPLPPTPPYGPLGAGEGTQPRTVTVGPGDTLSSIAEKTLGDPARAWQIARTNGLANANRLSPGQTLILPASAAETPNPRPRPDYYGGLRSEGGSSGESPFSGGAGAQASPGDVAALSANDNGPKGQSYIPGSRLPPAMQPNMMQDYFRNLKPLPVSKPANQARVGSTLLGGEAGDTLDDFRTHMGPPPDVQKRWDVGDAMQREDFAEVLAGSYGLNGGTMRQPSFNLAGKRESRNIETQTEPVKARPGERATNTYDPYDLSDPAMAEYARRVSASPPMGRPGVPWLSHSPASPDYGKENPAARGIPNEAERYGLSRHTAFSPWSPEYNNYQGRLEQYPDIYRGR